MNKERVEQLLSEIYEAAKRGAGSSMLEQPSPIKDRFREIRQKVLEVGSEFGIGKGDEYGEYGTAPLSASKSRKETPPPPSTTRIHESFDKPRDSTKDSATERVRDPEPCEIADGMCVRQMRSLLTFMDQLESHILEIEDCVEDHGVRVQGWIEITERSDKERFIGAVIVQIGQGEIHWSSHRTERR